MFFGFSTIHVLLIQEFRTKKSLVVDVDVLFEPIIHNFSHYCRRMECRFYVLCHALWWIIRFEFRWHTRHREQYQFFYVILVLCCIMSTYVCTEAMAYQIKFLLYIHTLSPLLHVCNKVVHSFLGTEIPPKVIRTATKSGSNPINENKLVFLAEWFEKTVVFARG